MKFSREFTKTIKIILYIFIVLFILNMTFTSPSFHFSIYIGALISSGIYYYLYCKKTERVEIKVSLNRIIFVIVLYCSILLMEKVLDLFPGLELMSLPLMFCIPIIYGCILGYFANIKYALYLSFLYTMRNSIIGYFFIEEKLRGEAGMAILYFMGLFFTILCILGAFIGRLIKKKKMKVINCEGER